MSLYQNIVLIMENGTKIEASVPTSILLVGLRVVKAEASHPKELPEDYAWEDCRNALTGELILRSLVKR